MIYKIRIDMLDSTAVYVDAVDQVEALAIAIKESHINPNRRAINTVDRILIEWVSEKMLKTKQGNE